MLTSKGGKGLLYEVLCVTHRERNESGFGLTLSLPPVLFENKNDMFLWDVDYATPRDLSRINIQLYDGNMDLLVLPKDSQVSLLCKVFHATHHR